MEAIDAKFSDPSEDLEKMFAEMGEGYRVQIKRIEPEWCNGIVGTFEFDPTEPISTKWIAKRFGGRKLQIKILTPDGKYSGARTLTFPLAPKEDGQELIPGPHGAPILASRAIVEQPQAPQETGLVSALEKIMQAQAQQNQALQNMLIGRVAGLEQLLTQRIETPGNGQQQISPADPNASLKTTLESFKMMEELRESLGAPGGGGDDEENPLLSKVMDKMIEKLTEEKPQAAPPGSPPLPERTEPSNLELAGMVKNRLQAMDPDEREFYLSTVFEDESEESDEFIDETIDTPIDTGQNSDLDLGSLLSGEDQEKLEQANDESSAEPPNRQAD